MTCASLPPESPLGTHSRERPQGKPADRNRSEVDNPLERIGLRKVFAQTNLTSPSKICSNPARGQHKIDDCVVTDSRLRCGRQSSRSFRKKRKLFSISFWTDSLITELRRHGTDHLAAFSSTLLDILLPPTCLLCGDGIDHGDLCGDCDVRLLSSWPALVVPCRFCGMPRSKLPVPPFDQPCGGCPPRPFPFNSVTPLGIYQGAVREAVVATKRAAHGALAGSLGVRLGKIIQISDFISQIDCVTFVPTHRWRRLVRGGPSAAQRLAISVGKVLKVPTIELLATARWVGKQSLLPDEKREVNVRGAFRIKRSYAWQRSPNLRDQHILLVDDVLTTGATAKESTNVLLQAGAASVRLAVVARAVRR